MSQDFKLIYWPLPFRGNFILALLEYAQVSYAVCDFEAVVAYKTADCHQQPVAGMAPPILLDCKTGQCVNQMPAIVFYLAHKLNLMPNDTMAQAMVIKIVLDCNDVLSELTNANGNVMWEYAKWREFRSQRLPRWLEIFNAALQEGDMKTPTVFTNEICAADLAVFALFGTMMRCLPSLQDDVKAHAPDVFKLCEYIGALPQIHDWFVQQQAAYGDVYCGGEIEQSIRAMLKEDAQ